MSEWIRTRLTYANVVATLCLIAVLGTGSAFAASKFVGKDKKVYSCAIKKGKKKGTIRLVTAKAKCKKRTEEKIAWNQTGPAGGTGPTGPAGPTAPGSAGAGVPTGAVMLFDADSCPAEWTEYTEGRGRYLVGKPEGGTRGAVIGTALSDQEDRPTGRHNHTVTDPGHLHTAAGQADIDAGNVTIGQFQGNRKTLATPRDGTLQTDLATTGITINDAGSVAGTNAPYVQLLACRKN